MTDPFEFDAAIAVEPAATAGTSAATIHPGFTVGPKPNGGYLVALAAAATARALADDGSEHVDPLITTTHFLHAPDPGPATVDVEVLRTGRSATQARATVRQDGRACVDVTLTMGTLGTDAPVWSAVPPVDVAPFDDCHRLRASGPASPLVVSILDRCDVRLDPRCLAFTGGRASGTGDLYGWVDFPDGRPIDALAMVFLLDALPPATVDIGPSGWVPTLSLTTYLRARPAPGPLRVRQRAQVVAARRLDEVCELWDATGALVGQATQLAVIRFDDESAVVPPPTA